MSLVSSARYAKGEREEAVFITSGIFSYLFISKLLCHDDDDVYYSKGRRPREDEEGEESYEKRRQ